MLHFITCLKCAPNCCVSNMSITKVSVYSSIGWGGSGRPPWSRSWFAKKSGRPSRSWSRFVKKTGGHPESQDEKVNPILDGILSPSKLPAHGWSIMCLSKQCHYTHQSREIDFLGSILPGVWLYPMTIGWEARTLPLFNAVPVILKHNHLFIKHCLGSFQHPLHVRNKLGLWK